jgi:flagellar basal-body rod modification protein FlgD
MSMTVAPTQSAAASALAGTTASNSAGATSTLDFTKNFNTFLTLLTTQLQNQDPLSPMDTNTFTQQLVSFSQVEQQIDTNNNLQSLIGLQTTNESIAALPLVGQQIEYSGASAPLENGQAQFSYSLPSTAAQTALQVTDGNGNVVYASTGETAAGDHSFTWNGKTNGGQQLPDGGAYTLQVIATDANKAAITPTINSIGTVDSVSVANNVASFDVGGVSVPIGSLVSVNPNKSGSGN